jgi:transposase-like protein
MKKDLVKGLSEEQIAKAKACKNQEELLKLAKEEGVELTSEQIEAVTGGGCLSSMECPNCGSKDFRKLPTYQVSGCSTYKCNKCGHEWSL